MNDKHLYLGPLWNQNFLLYHLKSLMNRVLSGNLIEHNTVINIDLHLDSKPSNNQFLEYICSLNLPSYLISTGLLLDRVFKTKIDFLSGSQSKESHGHPRGQLSWKKSLIFKNVLNTTWQGHSSYLFLKVSTHKFSQFWSLLHWIMHNPKSMLFSFLQASKLSSFWGVGFSPQTQIGFGQSEQPFGQFTLHGQS